MIVLKWLFFIAVGAVAEHFVFPLVNVCGNSMFPTYHDGEIILSRRIFRKNKIKPGDVMVFKHPTVKNRLLIKRVSEVFRDKKGEVQSIYFLGDNAQTVMTAEISVMYWLKTLFQKSLNQEERRRTIHYEFE